MPDTTHLLKEDSRALIRSISFLTGNYPLTIRLHQQEFVRWILDPQRWNKYTYALNNPVRYVDPDGEDPQDALEILRKSVERLGGFRGLVQHLVSKGTVVAHATQIALDTVLGPNIVFSPRGLRRNKSFRRLLGRNVTPNLKVV